MNRASGIADSTVRAASEELVSVIIPTYNRAQLVLEAIESVRAQTYPHLQIIVVDDGSADDTKELLANQNNLLVLSQEHQGQSVARNLGLKYAEGKFICTLDSDDLWEPTFIERSIAALHSSNADFVFTNWSSLDERTGEISRSYLEELRLWNNFPPRDSSGWFIIDANSARSIFQKACICPSSAIVFRRQTVLEGWTNGLNVADDWCLLLDIVLHKPCIIAFTMEKLWKKRVTGDNLCDGVDPIELDKKLMYRDMWAMFNRNSPVLTAAERSNYGRRLAHASLRVVALEWRQGNTEAALSAASHMMRALKTAVFNEPSTTVNKFLRLSYYRLSRSTLPAVEDNVIAVKHELLSAPQKELA